MLSPPFSDSAQAAPAPERLVPRTPLDVGVSQGSGELARLFLGWRAHLSDEQVFAINVVGYLVTRGAVTAFARPNMILDPDLDFLFRRGDEENPWTMGFDDIMEKPLPEKPPVYIEFNPWWTDLESDAAVKMDLIQAWWGEATDWSGMRLKGSAPGDRFNEAMAKVCVGRFIMLDRHPLILSQWWNERIKSAESWDAAVMEPGYDLEAARVEDEGEDAWVEAERAHERIVDLRERIALLEAVTNLLWRGHDFREDERASLGDIPPANSAKLLTEETAVSEAVAATARINVLKDSIAILEALKAMSLPRRNLNGRIVRETK